MNYTYNSEMCLLNKQVRRGIRVCRVNEFESTDAVHFVAFIFIFFEKKMSHSSQNAVLRAIFYVLHPAKLRTNDIQHDIHRNYLCSRILRRMDFSINCN